MARRALDVHEAFASNLALENEVLWDAYTPRQFPLFKQKLKELFRDAGARGCERNKSMERVREVVYKSAVSQTKYTNKNLLSTFILVTVAEGKSYIQARDATKFSVHLVIRTRKCMKNNNSSSCCMIHIDEYGRVYKNWNSFKENNLLPKGIALAPNKGIYMFENGQLSMDSWETPANGINSKVLATSDVAACVGGFTAAGVGLVGLATPIAAPVVATAALVCAGTGLYSAVRSGWTLKIRSDHEQSIALTNREARGCWLGVTSGALAVSASVASQTLAQLALAGKEISLIRETVVNGMNISTMLLSGTGVANGILDIILKFSDEEEITTADWLQVAASLAVFTHSVHNFQMASSLINKQTSGNSYRTELSNRLKNIFNKMTEGTFYGTDAVNSKSDLIRLPNEIPDHMNPNQAINELFSLSKISSACLNVIRIVEPLLLNMDNLQNCIVYLTNNVGENITVYLMEKTRLFLDGFRHRVEAFIKTTLYYETALWDLYKNCEEHLVTLTMEILEKNISIIFNHLLSYYQKMSCESLSTKIIHCKECQGHYQVCALE